MFTKVKKFDYSNCFDNIFVKCSIRSPNGAIC